MQQWRTGTTAPSNGRGQELRQPLMESRKGAAHADVKRPDARAKAKLEEMRALAKRIT